MHFSRIALFALPAIAAASVLPREGNTCIQGTSQFCCNSIQSANQASFGVKALLALAGANLDNLTGQLGVACNPVTGAGAGLGGAAAFGATGCNQQTTCCQDSAANGFIGLNCNSGIINA